MKYLFSIPIVWLFTFPSFAQTWQGLPTGTAPAFHSDTISIATYNAVGDGLTLNTSAIQQSIDKASQQGGVVLVPPGLWLTGPIVLKAGVNLHVMSGATLLFTSDFNQYPLIQGNWEGLPQMRNQSPISANDAENIAITGGGIIDGNGDAWRMVKKDKLTDSQWKKKISNGGILSDDKKTWYPSVSSKRGAGIQNPGVISPEKDKSFYEGIKDFLRPNLVVFSNCRNILLEGVTFQNSPAWCLHPLLCENLVVRNIRVKNPWYAQNGDGIDVESCRNVWIQKSVFDVGDDALCMKSGRDAAGRARGKATENVYIKDCIVYASHGGFVIGSEMSGGVRNVYVERCSFIGSDIGLRFKTARGRGGVVENIYIRDIYMKDIPAEAILFDMYYMARDPIPLAGEERALPKVEKLPVDESTPVFRNFHISNVYCSKAATGIFMRGLPEMHVSDIILENMVLQAYKGMDIQESSGITFRNIRLLTPSHEPAIDIIQSDHLIFEKISNVHALNTFMRIAGERTAGIEISDCPGAKSKSSIKFELGANADVLKIK